MAEQYKRDLLRISTAQICQTIGYNMAQLSPLELLQDILDKFLLEFCRDLHRNVEHNNRRKPVLKDVCRTLRDLNVNCAELLDYINNVEPVAFAVEVPKFPARKSSSLNYFQPGSKELATRPEHVYEYLPSLILTENTEKSNVRPRPDLLVPQKKEAEEEGEAMEKLLPLSTSLTSGGLPLSRKPFLTSAGAYLDSQFKPTRELSSVIMTTGGYISPAVEGKLSESIIPDIVRELQGLDCYPPPVAITKAIDNDRKEPLINEKKKIRQDYPEKKEVKSESKIPSALQKLNAEASIAKPSFNLPNQTPAIASKLLKKAKKNMPTNALSLQGRSSNKLEPVNTNSSTSGMVVNIKESLKVKKRKLKLLQKASKKGLLPKNHSLKLEDLDRLGEEGNLQFMQCDPMEIVQMKKALKKQNKQKEKMLRLETKGGKHAKEKMKMPAIVEPMDSVKYEEDSKTFLSLMETPKVEMALEQTAFPDSIPGKSEVNSNETSELNVHSDKLSNEPDRNKINIFKKITKPKTTKALVHINEPKSNTVFQDSDNNLISLPSGTTITPAPPVGDQKSFLPEQPVNLVKNKDVPPPSNIPKKRGRKPGSKNQPKVLVPNNAANLVQFNKVSGSNFVNPLNAANMHLSGGLSLFGGNPPLNLDSQQQFPLDYPLVKGKTKKMKTFLPESGAGSTLNSALISPPGAVKPLNNDLQLLDTMINSKANKIAFLQHTDFPAKDAQLSAGFMPPTMSGLAATGAAFPPGSLKKTPPNMQGLLPPSSNLTDLSTNPSSPYLGFPLMPIYPFPSQPGLIPSPGLFPSPNFAKFPNTGAGAVNPLIRTLLPPLQQTQEGLTSPTTVKTEKSLMMADRNYCNVAPFKPDAMPMEHHQHIVKSNISKEHSKVANLKKMSNLFAPLERIQNPDEPIEVSDDSNESAATIEKHSIQEQLPKNFNINYNPLQLLSTPESSAGKKSLSGDESSNKTSKKMNKAKASILQAESTGIGKLAGGAELIPLSETGLAYSARSIPSNSLTAPFSANLSKEPRSCGNVFGDFTLINPKEHGSSFESDLELKRKEHKKLKKLKDCKVKKKRDKKEKIKSKERMERFSEKAEKTFNERDLDLPNPERDFIKKLKKEKKKQKQRFTEDMAMLEPVLARLPPTPMNQFTPLSLDINDRLGNVNEGVVGIDGLASGVPANELAIAAAASVPKITLKLNTSQSPILAATEQQSLPSDFSLATPEKREPSPELARISPLVTRPPKSKPSCADLSGQNTIISSSNNVDVLNSSSVIPPPSPWMPGDTLTASSVLLPQQLQRHSVPSTKLSKDDKAVTLSPSNTSTPLCEEEPAAAAVPLVAETDRPSSYIDAEGNRVWICPACGRVDDGSPMIGCDGCDAWYHWLCVGIVVAPKDNEDWFCRVCLTKKKTSPGGEKKKKRSKKNKSV